MPIYEYRCLDCAQLFEEWQKDFQSREVPCPVCGGKSERLISNTSFVLKGSGWYVTDYCGGSSQSKPGPAKTGNGRDGGDSGGDSSASQTKEGANAKSAGDKQQTQSPS